MSGTSTGTRAGLPSNNKLSAERIYHKNQVENLKPNPTFSKPTTSGLSKHNCEKDFGKASTKNLSPPYFGRNSPLEAHIRTSYKDNPNERRDIYTGICKTCKEQARKIEILQKELAKANDMVHVSEKRIKDQNYYLNELDSLRSQILLKSKSTKEIETMKEEYERKLNVTSKTLKDLESQNKYFIKENLSIRRGLEEEIQTYKEKIKDLKNENEQLKRKNTEANYYVRKETEQFENQKEYIRKLKEKNEEKIKMISGLKYDIDKFSKTVEEKQKRVCALEKEIEKEMDFNRALFEKFQEILVQRNDSRRPNHARDGSGSAEKIKNQHENLKNLFGTPTSFQKAHNMQVCSPEKEKRFKEILEINEKIVKENQCLMDDLFSQKKMNERLLEELKNKEKKSPTRMSPPAKPREFDQYTRSPGASRPYANDKNMLNETNMLRQNNHVLLDENKKLLFLLENIKKEFLENNRKLQDEAMIKTKLEKIAKVYEKEFTKIRNCLENEESENKSPASRNPANFELHRSPYSDNLRTPERNPQAARNIKEHTNRDLKTKDFFSNYLEECSQRFDASPRLEIVQQNLDDTLSTIQKILNENKLLKKEALHNHITYKNTRLITANPELYELINSLEDRNKNLLEEVKNAKRKDPSGGHYGTQHTIELLKAEIECLKGEGHRMESQYTELEEKASKDQQYIQKLDIERQMLIEERNKLLSEKLEINKENKELLAGKIKDYNDAIQGIQDKEQEINLLKDDYEDTRQRLKEAYEQVKKEKKKIAELLNENMLLEERAESAIGNEKIANGKIEGLKIDFKQMINTFDKELEAKDKIIDDNKAYISELEVAVDSLQEKCNEVQISKASDRDYSALLADHKRISIGQDLKTEKILLVGELDEKEREINELRKEFEEEMVRMEVELEHCIERIRKLEFELNQRNSYQEESFKIDIDYRSAEDNDKAEEENKGLKIDNLEKSRIIKELKEELSKQSAQQKENFDICIEYQANENITMRNGLLAKINDLEREISEIQENSANENNKLRAENSDNRKEIKELQEALAKSMQQEENMDIRIEYEPEDSIIAKNKLIDRIVDLEKEISYKDMQIKELELMKSEGMGPESINLKFEYATNIEEIANIRYIKKEKRSKLTEIKNLDNAKIKKIKDSPRHSR